MKHTKDADRVHLTLATRWPGDDAIVSRVMYEVVRGARYWVGMYFPNIKGVSASSSGDDASVPFDLLLDTPALSQLLDQSVANVDRTLTNLTLVEWMVARERARCVWQVEQVWETVSDRVLRAWLFDHLRSDEETQNRDEPDQGLLTLPEKMTPELTRAILMSLPPDRRSVVLAKTEHWQSALRSTGQARITTIVQEWALSLGLTTPEAESVISPDSVGSESLDTFYESAQRLHDISVGVTNPCSLVLQQKAEQASAKGHLLEIANRDQVNWPRLFRLQDPLADPALMFEEGLPRSTRDWNERFERIQKASRQQISYLVMRLAQPSS